MQSLSISFHSQLAASSPTEINAVELDHRYINLPCGVGNFETGSFDYLATFELFDVNGDGNVTVDELTSIFIRYKKYVISIFVILKSACEFCHVYLQVQDLSNTSLPVSQPMYSYLPSIHAVVSRLDRPLEGWVNFIFSP